MHNFSEGKIRRTSRLPYFVSNQYGHIELGSVLVIVVVLGVIVYMGLTDTTWADLSILGKGVIVGAVVVSVLGARIFNESSKWPNANFESASKKSEKDDAAERDDKNP